MISAEKEFMYCLPQFFPAWWAYGPIIPYCSARVVWHLVPRQFHWAASLQQQAQVGLALASGSSGISVGVPLANRGCLVKALLKLWWHRFKPRGDGEGVWVRQKLKVKTEIFTTFSTTFMTFQRTCCKCDTANSTDGRWQHWLWNATTRRVPHEVIRAWPVFG